MNRYITILEQGAYELAYDRENKLYAIFRKWHGHSQQISKWYIYYGAACNKFKQIMEV